MKGKVLKGSAVVFGAVVISTLGIFASDRMQGIDRSLVGLSGMGGSAACSPGATLLKINGDMLCVDIYEATPSEECPHDDPRSALESEENAGRQNCYAVSMAGKLPWRFVSLTQAQRMCAQGGKRLPTPDEWYEIAIGGITDHCVITEAAVQKTGTESCIASSGAYDTIGNVWEWVDVTVVGRVYEGRSLPPSGYVSSVDASGIAITSHESFQELYGSDYVWSKEDGVFGMLRGGFFGSQDDAGLYAVNASVPTSFATQGVGFRCVEDVL